MVCINTIWGTRWFQEQLQWHSTKPSHTSHNTDSNLVTFCGFFVVDNLQRHLRPTKRLGQAAVELLRTRAHVRSTSSDLDETVKESWIFSGFHSLAFQANSTIKGIWPSLIWPVEHQGWGADVFASSSSRYSDGCSIITLGPAFVVFTQKL